VHGENDPLVPATQSDALFRALDRRGVPCRLVLLPGEGATYRARESILHVIYETHRWLDRHVKGREAGVLETEETTIPGPGKS
jgi:dipeptidyl aminopeptidase/acylaminoacyl peptidase